MNNNQEFEYQGYKYVLEGSNHEVYSDKKQPDEIYKYYYPNENSIDALVNQYLYATHPYLFNDSIDSSELLLDYSNITLERYKSFYKQILKPEEYIKYNFDEIFVEDKKNGYASIRTNFHQYFSRQYGIISLTTNPLNILMWSNYSSEKGFMIELDRNCVISNLIKLNRDIKNYCFRPVQYVKELEAIDMFQPPFTTPDIPFLYATNVKRAEWEYEDEWRLSVYKTDMGIPFNVLLPGIEDYEGNEERKIYYDKSCIKAIVVGKHFFNGKNCSKQNLDGSFEISDKDFLKLLTYLSENHNDKLFISGELHPRC